MSEAKQEKSTELLKKEGPAGTLAETSTGEELRRFFEVVAATVPLIPGPITPYHVGADIGELREKLKGACDENAKLKEKLREFKKENASLGSKVGKLEKENHLHTETIRSLEDAQGKLEKDLEAVKKAKEKLRVEVEEKTSRFNSENEALKENLESLKNELEIVEAENKQLKQILERLSCDNDRLKETVGSIQEENAKLREDMGKLQKEHSEIRTKLECKKTRLALGQVAWLLEQEIWKNVLPGKTMGKTRILNSMERWLKKNSQSEEGKIAQKRWDELKGKLNWDDDDHRSALKILKDLRVEDAHPPVVDLEEARKQLNEGDYVAESDKESCQDIIDMITKARSINEGTQ